MTNANAPKKPTPALILDSGAVIAISRDDNHAKAAVRKAVQTKATIYVPVVVLTETLRGGPRDAAVHRVLNTIDNELPLSATMARRAGRLLGETDSDVGAVDAIVAATAIALKPSVILTTDPDDMRPLTRDHPEVAVYPLS